MERNDAGRGAVLLPTLPAKPELTPEAAGVLEEVPGYLGVPFVSPVFLALANWPDYLVPAWNAFKPVIGSPEFAEAVARLRVPAGLLPAPDPSLLTDDTDTDLIRRYTTTFHQLLPELLLLTSCWYRGLTADGSASAARPGAPGPGPRGIRPDAVNVTPDGTTPTPELARVYEEIRATHDHPRVLSFYRALGNWPGFMTGAWERLGPIACGARYAAAREEVLATAAAAAAVLPVPVIDTAAAEEARSILALFRGRLIPALLLDTAAVLALLGETDAIVSA
ncbi:halocarboxylic acid dehydrogenase DehI family protein [Streptomyces blattellae]|uniref:halocarboxylic acid dehydrogenase DehI family protein n=1 Tax=Streptomyces blattellae TaxID=2569855 RepID=UPI0018AD0E4B|nr:halocarboxylic acid dehydrogenase DehI family protein [Streptomyces blattellae]